MQALWNNNHWAVTLAFLVTMVTNNVHVFSAQPDKNFEKKELLGIVLDTLTTRTEVQCTMKCAAADDCDGASYDAGQSTCKLLGADASKCDNPLPSVNEDTGTITLRVTADNALKIYVDGEFIEQDGSWSTEKVYTLPKRTRTIAVHAWDSGGEYGLIASVDDSDFITDQSWRCIQSSNNPNGDVPDWYDVCFDDSSWDNARIIGPKGMGPWGNNGCANMNSATQWIWSSAGSSTHALCRASPHRCLLSTKPAPSADCSSVITSPTAVYDLSPGGAEFVELDDEYVHGCDDGVTRVAMRCDVGGQWVVTNGMASYNGYWLT